MLVGWPFGATRLFRIRNKAHIINPTSFSLNGIIFRMEVKETTIVSNNHPQITILIENPKKNCNWGPLLRCCAAFGISQIFVIGFDTCSVHGSHGASKHVELLSFPTHTQALEALRTSGYKLLGVLNGAANAYSTDGYQVVQEEPDISIEKKPNDGPMVTVSRSSYHQNNYSKSNTFPKSYPIHARPFYQKTCLVVGRQAIGLPLTLAKLCHGFVHIPHQAQLKTTNDHTTIWLNGESCVSIIFHEFSAWAKFDDSNYQGQKYEVTKIVKGDTENRTNKRDERKRKYEERLQENPDNIASFFHPDDDGDY